MLCEKCGQREATVHKQTNINGVSHSEHLCSECAAKAQEAWMSSIGQFFSGDMKEHPLNNWFAPFFQQSAGAAKTKEIPQACPRCGTSWEAFQKNGLLGCSDCYTHFADALPALLRRLHGHTEHVGKTPQGEGSTEVLDGGAEFAGSQSGFGVLSEEIRLKQAMKEAIETENFEEAARLRDKLRALQAEEANSGEHA